MHLRPDNRRGSQAIEFALILPVLFITIMGTMNYAWYFCHQLMLDECTEKVARTASIRIVDDANVFAAANWHADGQACWEATGLPNFATFRTEVKSSGGALLVHVTGDVPFADLLGGNREGQKDFGSGAGKVSWQYLPGVVSSTSVKYMATQSISDIPLGG